MEGSLEVTVTEVPVTRSVAHRRRQSAAPSVRHPVQRGAALLEFALLALPLAVVIMTAVDFGARASYHNQLRGAARQGAILAEVTPGRVAACPAGVDDVGDRIRSYDDRITLQPNFGYRVLRHPSGVALPSTCSLDVSPVAPGAKVAVEVYADHRAISPLSKWLMGETVTGRAIVVVQG